MAEYAKTRDPKVAPIPGDGTQSDGGVKRMDRDALGQYVLKRHEVLKSKRSQWDSWWQEVANFCMPRKAEIMTFRTNPSAQRDAVLFDGTMVQANIILSNGCMSYLTPADQRWFAFDPPAYLKGVDPVDQYFRHCTEIAMLELANSNFYSEVHELYLDRGCFGTAVLHCEEGRRSFLNFKKFDVGTFSIAEDDEGYVDTLSREFMLTARQAVQWFGKENVSDIIAKAFDSTEPTQMEKEFLFIHQIFPRAADEIEYGIDGRAKRDAQNLPIASVYVEKDKKLVVRISGFSEQPFFATRYMKWLAEHAYGWSPSWIALPDARQLNFLQKQLDALAELAAFPRFLIPDTHEGEVDFRASGVTYFDAANPNARPSEWATAGRYDVGKDRVEAKQKSIDRAFHVDLFQLFANLERPQMTAREVGERASEKLVQFSPTFARMTTEFFTPMLQRVWSIMIRGGRMPPPPQELIQQAPTGQAFIPKPDVSYSSRIALAIKALENGSLMNLFEMWMPVAAQKPELLDNVNWDVTFRDSARNSGLPVRWLLEADQVGKIREARQQQMEEAQKKAEQMQMADAAGKVGNIKQDSVVGRALTSMNGQNGGAPPGR
jgi:Bacteriophage head to tail connecting protein